MVQRLTQDLRWLSLAAGLAVVSLGYYRFLTGHGRPPLLLALAVLVVGPLEDLLKAWARRTGATDQEKMAWSSLIDQATSLIFLVFLFQALVL